MKIVNEVNMVLTDEVLDSLCSVNVCSAVRTENCLVRSGEMNLSRNSDTSSGNLCSRMPNPSMPGKAESKPTVSLRNIED